ncbi:MAG: enoyl-CoA hydratase/isomerase family protein [Betaproteobacteria bacterium]|nr:MAG: enoyl-CoA hydratase/isomerase family protein [Betaproteobacteria bacterium]
MACSVRVPAWPSGCPRSRSSFASSACLSTKRSHDVTSTLDITRDGAVARIFLNRPDVRNAFNDAVIAELTQAFGELSADTTLRAIVLGGHGKAFCAGADLSWMRAMADYDWEQNRADAQKLADMLWTIYSCPLPVVGRIHGDCYAGGVGLAAVCDVLVAAEGMNFCLSEAKLGLLPATIAPYVVKALGEQAARRYFVSAERFDAATAKALGFVHEVAAADALDAKVDEIVAAIVANGPAAVKACKQLVKDVAARPITAELRADTARRIADIRASDEGKEGVQSFLAKRKPTWLP